MKKYLRYLGPLLVTGIFLLAVYLLYHKLKAYSIAQIRESIQQISYGRIGVSLVLMVINYMILVGYDWLALKAIHKKLPLPRVGLVSFVGQAVSYNFGALLGGTSVRYRFYSAWGFSLAEIVRLVLMLAVTFWVGALGLCGVIFLLAPPYIPEELLTNMPIKDVRVLGLLLTLVACSYLVLCFTMRKPVHIFGREFVFPAPRIAVAQCIVAGVDIVAAAACMYVLLPGDIGISFLDFLPSYLMAQVAVVLTHIPGGVVRHPRSMLREAGRWLSVLSHSISAYLVFVAGLILLVSATLPTAPRTIALLTQWLPMGVLGVGHFVCALSGAALLFVAYGLERRQARAFHLATGLLCFGIIGALLKGLAWEPALMVAVVLLAVCLAHRRFYRRSFFWEEPIPAYWLFGALAALGLVFLLGWFLYHPAWDRATTWGFERPFNASRTLRAFLGITVVLMVSWCWRLLLRQRRRRRQHRQRQA